MRWNDSIEWYSDSKGGEAYNKIIPRKISIFGFGVKHSFLRQPSYAQQLSDRLWSDEIRIDYLGRHLSRKAWSYSKWKVTQRINHTLARKRWYIVWLQFSIVYSIINHRKTCNRLHLNHQTKENWASAACNWNTRQNDGSLENAAKLSIPYQRIIAKNLQYENSYLLLLFFLVSYLHCSSNPNRR